jgi:hypothetical protein
MLDNHTVELETQGKTLICRITKRRKRGDNSKANSLKSSILNLKSPMWGKASLAMTLYAWIPTLNDIHERHLIKKKYSGTIAGELEEHLTTSSSSSKEYHNSHDKCQKFF